ncbi:LOB domain-containing protein 16-like [Phragmites australis]|uniref:LOB domain-containing protein 16-like n=1 Tax=Phragmites australis TaxID=29695 RepID=UPI002D7995AB|nr:LOB domain-containing protein 16-like [Phragmites australis]
MASSGDGGAPGSPCGACKFLRRKCAVECVFAPHFCAEDGAAQFAAIHKVFGASNAAKLLQQVAPGDRSEAAATVTYEAQARLRDPIYGCVAHIFALQQQVASLQMQVLQAKTQVAQTMAAAGAQTAGSPLLQRWQMDPESLSTQSSGCYSAPSCDGSASLQEMYCFGEQEEGSYTR